MGIKFDLHIHTNRYSMCSTVSPDEVISEARRNGLDGLVLTEHNTFWPEADLRELRDRYPTMTILNGAEIDVPSLHHVLTILPSPDRGLVDPTGPREFIDDVNRHDGVAIAAHPFRFFENYDRRNRDYPLHAVEIASGNMCDAVSRDRSRALAEQWNAKTVASSDAHALGPVGKFYTTLPEPVESETELITLLKNKPVAPEVPFDE